MSFHVYVARQGWKETPITPEEWEQAIHEVPELTAVRHRNGAVRACLTRDPRQGLGLLQGCGHAQNPDTELVAAMFRLADRLGASVYSERAVVYTSVDDWEKRTRGDRAQRKERVAESRHARRRRIATLAAAILGVFAAGLALGWLF